MAGGGDPAACDHAGSGEWGDGGSGGVPLDPGVDGGGGAGAPPARRADGGVGRSGARVEMLRLHHASSRRAPSLQHRRRTLTTAWWLAASEDAPRSREEGEEATTRHGSGDEQHSANREKREKRRKIVDVGNEWCSLHAGEIKGRRWCVGPIEARGVHGGGCKRATRAWPQRGKRVFRESFA